MVISSMKKHKVPRSVVISSIGIEEDWPPAEFHRLAKYAMSFMFLTPLARGAFRDLTEMERAYKKAANDKDHHSINYCFVRPVGLGEDTVPIGKCFIQKKKHKDVVGIEIAKMDVVRFMVEEALTPTFYKEAVVVGGEPPVEKGTKRK